MPNKKPKAKKESFREQFSALLDVPPEIMNDLPKVVIVGNKEINVENFIGLLEYTMQRIRINTKSGVIVIEGVELEATKMTSEYIKIKGTILQVSYLQ